MVEYSATASGGGEVVDLYESDSDKSRSEMIAQQRRRHGQSKAIAYPEIVAFQKRHKSDSSVQTQQHQQGDRKAAPAIKNSVEVPGDDDMVHILGVVAAPPSSSPEVQVLDVFPDADLSYIKSLLLRTNNDVAATIVLLADNKSYPKAQQPTKPRKTLIKAAKQRQESETKWKYDYMSMSAFKPLPDYQKQAHMQLQYDFRFLSVQGITKLMKKHGSRYALCHDCILKIIISGRQVSLTPHKHGDDAEILKYESYLEAVSSGRLSTSKVQELNRSLKLHNLTLQKPRSCLRPEITEPVLLEEIEYVEHKIQLWVKDVNILRDRLRNKRAGGIASCVECSCCFTDFPIEEMVQCREAHLFCAECLQRYVETQVFSQGNIGIDKVTKLPALELKCFYSGNEGDCVAGFDRYSLEKALPKSTLEKYEELQVQVSIEKAGLNDLCTCPKCGFQAVLPTEQRVFACPVDDCQFESCRECGEASHIPLRCEEVEKESETKGRLTVEEAITAAKIRKCPKCKKGFVKSDGCNKIRCACGEYVCYICRSSIKGYDHFCQTPHCQHQSCKKCPLWTNAEQDDERAMREAGLKAAAQVESETAQQRAAGSASSTAAGVRIDVDSILKQPTIPAVNK